MDTATTPSTTDHAVRERLATSLREMVDEADHLLKTAQRGGSEQFAIARDKFEAQLSRARSELEALEDAAAYSVRRAARAADGAMHDHPYAAAGLAAGIGMLLGMLITRR